jgi:large subunit ribosomal protein L24
VKQQGKKLQRIQPIASKDWHLVKGDQVAVTGVQVKEGNSRGRIIEVDRKWNRVWVEGSNLRTRTIAATTAATGSTVKLESPIHMSNIQLIDPSNNQPTRIKHAYTEDGVRVRVSKSTGVIIPKPENKPLRTFPLNPMTDTPTDIVLKRTYIQPDWQRLKNANFSELTPTEQVELAFARQKT